MSYTFIPGPGSPSTKTVQRSQDFTNGDLCLEPISKAGSRHIDNYLERLGKAVWSIDRDRLAHIRTLIKRVAAEDRTIFICGNGGSSSTAQHWAADLTKNTPERRKIRCVCLSDNAAFMTAVSNDQSYGECFKMGILRLAKEGDMVILISGSGNSANILEAAAEAEAVGCVTIGITGKKGGKLAGYNLAEHLVIDSDDYGPIEDAHLVICHILVESLQDRP